MNDQPIEPPLPLAPPVHPGPFRRFTGLAQWSVGRGALGMLALRIGQIGAEFLNGLLLARLLGASGYGAYAFAMSWVGLLGIPAALGFDRLVIREVARFRADENWQLLRGILRRSGQATAIAAIGLALLAAIAAPYVASDLEPQMLEALQIGLIIIPLLAAARLRQAVLWGLGRSVWGQMPDALIQPLAFLCLLIGMFVLFRAEPTGRMAVGLQAMAVGLACGAGIIMVRRALPTEVLSARPEYQTSLWLRGALPFVWILGMNVIVSYADVVMLGSMLGAASAGVYRAASQLANLIALPLTAVQLALAPIIASLYAKRDLYGLQTQATRAAAIILAMSLPVFLVLIAFGDRILLLFGEEFPTGYQSLAILSGGYLVNAAMGPSGYLLIMTKHEHAAALTFAGSAAISIIGNLVLIPKWGINGAASATASSIIFVSVVFAVLAYCKLGIQPTALKVWRRSGSTRSRASDPPAAIDS